MSGSRLDVSLSALTLGAGPTTLGMLSALYGVLPILFGLSFGRLVDRVGVRVPMLLCLALFLVGMLAPFAYLSFATLGLSALCVGFGFMGGLVSTSNAVAALSTPERRTGMLGWLAAMASLGGALGPTLTGIGIDHFGHRATFGLTAIVPAVTLVLLLALGSGLPERSAQAARARGSALELMRNPRLRTMIWLAALVPIAMDTYFFFVPLIGAERGWSASITGLILGTSIGAVVFSRVFLPLASSRAGPWTLVVGSYLLIAAACVAIPWIRLPGLMLFVAVLIGLGAGIAPPVLTSLLYAASPIGRQGEVVGLRTAVLSGLSGAAPLVAGVLSGVLGMAPVLLATGAVLVVGARSASREGHRR